MDRSGRSRGGPLLPPGVLGCFSWPPRSYSCSFCKREFRSAQALGGHMNVHRREKARLRQSPPLSSLILCSNPNPNSSTDHLGGQSIACADHDHVHPILNLNIPPTAAASSCTCKGVIFPVAACAFPYVLSSQTCLSSSNSSSSKNDGHMMMSTRGVLKANFCGVKDQVLIDSSHEDHSRIRNGVAINNGSDQIVSLELEMGMLEDVEEKLDLELRLGYNID